MKRCPDCKRVKCKWIELKKRPDKVCIFELSAVVRHNIDYLQSSNYTGEAMFDRLEPYVKEISKRGVL